MKTNVGRNDPCWCGSGKKYKHCHLGREHERPIGPGEAGNELHKLLRKEECLAPNGYLGKCDKKIVNAHTVPRSGSLARIARDGHVYTFKADPLSLERTAGKPSPSLIGIKQASAFTGFCSRHDNEIFKPIEDQDFIGTPLQCFLLGYRAVAREFFFKKRTAEAIDDLKGMDRGKSVRAQEQIQQFLQVYETGTNAGLRDIGKHKSQFDEALVNGDVTIYHYYIIDLVEPPSIMCSGGVFPDYDFQGTQLQDLLNLDRTPSLITFSSFATQSGGAVVFSWLKDSDAVCQNLVNSLDRLSDQELPSAVVRFFFEYCENIFMSPSWWESLADTQQQVLIDRFSQTLDLRRARSAACLLDDGVAAVRWQVKGRRLNA
jgi:hypothetical protein